eukprot:TRINITY_DN6658_c0_g4_i2.p1 TRINITY_DN6658_c0_g4~~TRINITY_DN6658_c0_g4_i2.p1  ORF type:complete len:169 (+),score=25.19 TRINITY_DN6658_c0_g4_i2:66-572(+)
MEDERQKAGDSYTAANSGREDRLKIILLGDSAVGKSKLVERFLMDQYQPQQLSTYALTLFSYETTIDGQPLKMDFWDTAGQERFDSMHPSYYYKADCCILVFDVTRKVTYTNLLKWYKELQENRKGIPVIVVANKIDSMSSRIIFVVTLLSFLKATTLLIDYFSPSRL